MESTNILKSFYPENKEINKLSKLDYEFGNHPILVLCFSILLFKMYSQNTLDLQCYEMVLSLDAVGCPPMIKK